MCTPAAAQFTCFTSTKVQIQTEQLRYTPVYLLYWYKVRILTAKFARRGHRKELSQTRLPRHVLLQEGHGPRPARGTEVYIYIYTYLPAVLKEGHGPRPARGTEVQMLLKLTYADVC